MGVMKMVDFGPCVTEMGYKVCVGWMGNCEFVALSGVETGLSRYRTKY